MDSITGVGAMSNLKLKELFQLKNPATFLFNKHISDNGNEEKIKALLQDTESYNIIAPMNSGKTRSMLEIALKMNIKTIFICPLQINIDELKVKFKKKIYVIKGHKKNGKKVNLRHLNPGINIKNAKVFVVVYDSLEQLFRMELEIKKFNLIIDEAHHLINQFGFRYDAIRNIAEKKCDFRKILCLTGTPEGCLHYTYYKNIVFNPLQIRPLIKLNIVFDINQYKDIIKKYITKSGINKKNKLVVLLDNKEEIDELKKYLVAANPKIKILKLMSENKESRDFKRLSQKLEIQKGIDCLITTSVISDGLNIQNDNIHTVMLINSKNPIINRQFIARFRKGVKQNISLFLKKTDKIKMELQNIETIYEDLLPTFQKDLENERQRQSLIKERGIKLKSKKYGPEHKVYVNESKEAFLSQEAIVYDLYQQFNENLHKDPNLLVEYYKEIAHYDVTSLTMKEFNIRFLGARDKENTITLKDIDEKETFLTFPREIINRSLMNICNGVFYNKKDSELYNDAFPSGKIDRLNVFCNESPHFKNFIQEKRVNLLPEGTRNFLITKRLERSINYANTAVDKININSYFQAINKFPELLESPHPQLFKYQSISKLDQVINAKSKEIMTKNGYISNQKLEKVLAESFDRTYSIGKIKDAIYEWEEKKERDEAGACFQVIKHRRLKDLCCNIIKDIKKGHCKGLNNWEDELSLHPYKLLYIDLKEIVNPTSIEIDVISQIEQILKLSSTRIAKLAA
jgi:hypothetical protein